MFHIQRHCLNERIQRSTVFRTTPRQQALRQAHRSFLDQDISTMIPEPVFTHGDVRTDNIMVKESTGYAVTASIQRTMNALS